MEGENLKKRKPDYLIWLVFVISLAFIISYASAFNMSSFSYKLKGILTEGGNTTSSDSYISTFSFAQPVIGRSSGSTYKVCLGIYCTDVFEGYYEVFIQGKLNYGNGTAVSDSEVKGVINYRSYNFETTNKTDSTGNFVTVINIPEFVYNKDFRVKIYAIGEIEALYECDYNRTTEKCS